MALWGGCFSFHEKAMHKPMPPAENCACVILTCCSNQLSTTQHLSYTQKAKRETS